ASPRAPSARWSRSSAGTVAGSSVRSTGGGPAIRCCCPAGAGTTWRPWRATWAPARWSRHIPSGWSTWRSVAWRHRTSTRRGTTTACWSLRGRSTTRRLPVLGGEPFGPAPELVAERLRSPSGVSAVGFQLLHRSAKIGQKDLAHVPAEVVPDHDPQHREVLQVRRHGIRRELPSTAAKFP